MKRIVATLFIVIVAGGSYLAYDWHAYVDRKQSAPNEILYSRTDANGVKRYTNTPPGPDAENIKKTTGRKYHKPPLVHRISSAISEWLSPEFRKNVVSLEDRIRKWAGKQRTKADDYVTFLPFVIAVAGLAVGLVLGAWLFRRVFRISLPSIRAGKQLSRLGKDEQAILREFFIQDLAVIQLPRSDEAVLKLMAKGLLAVHNDKENFSTAGPLVAMRMSVGANRKIAPLHIGMSAFDRTAPHMKSRPAFIYKIYPQSV